MITVHKGYCCIGFKYLKIRVYLELNKEDYNCLGSFIDTNEIANIALKRYCFRNQSVYGVFTDLLHDYMYVERDDSYDYETIEKMLEDSNKTDVSNWETLYNQIEYKVVSFEHNGKMYNCLIEVYIDK